MTLPSPLNDRRLSAIDGQSFDVAVVGGGINGSAAAARLAAAGYRVLLTERKDFGSGSSARSSRMMHCGLNYLALAKDVPSLRGKLRNLLLAGRMMRERNRLARSFPDRIAFKTLNIPLRKDDPVRPWQFGLAFLLLRLSGGGATPLNYRWTRGRDLAAHPLARYLGENLAGIASYSEAIFDWPERFCVDYALRAAGDGAAVLNYTALTGARQEGEGWQLDLSDSLHPGAVARVCARAVVNMAGVWSDQVNGLRGAGTPTVKPNRGCHLAVRLPAELRGIGLVNRNALGHMLICLPWQDFHILGPSETPLEDVDAPLRATDDDAAMLLREANTVMPGAGLGPGDVMFRWAGMRPASYEPGNPLGIWERRVHTSRKGDGPPWMSLSWGRLADHAFSARDAVRFASARLGKPAGGHPAPPTAAPAKAAGIAKVVTDEAPASVADVMFRRLGLGWHADRGLGRAEEAAEALSRLPGGKSVTDHLADYRRYLEDNFGPSGPA